MDEAIAELTLDVPWIPEDPRTLDGLRLRRGRDAELRYLTADLDGITQRVEVEFAHRSLDPDMVAARARAQPAGQLFLIVGPVPLELRAPLRDRMVSFLATDGTAEIFWPRLRVSASRFTDEVVERRTSAVTLRGSHARVVQALLAADMEGDVFETSKALGLRAGVGPSVVSRLLQKLARQGLVVLEREAGQAQPRVADRVALATLLRDERGWASARAVYGYVYGRDVIDRAARITNSASSDPDADDVAISGAVGAMAYDAVAVGVTELRVWLSGLAESPPEPRLLAAGIEPAARHEANCQVAFDRDGIGLLGARDVSLGHSDIRVAHPLRVWCDVHDELRGDDIAAELWSRMW